MHSSSDLTGEKTTQRAERCVICMAILTPISSSRSVRTPAIRSCPTELPQQREEGKKKKTKKPSDLKIAVYNYCSSLLGLSCSSLVCNLTQSVPWCSTASSPVPLDSSCRTQGLLQIFSECWKTMASKPDLGGAEKETKNKPTNQIDSIFFYLLTCCYSTVQKIFCLWVSICICMSVCIYIYLYREKSYTTGLAFIKCSSGAWEGREQDDTATDEL